MVLCRYWRPEAPESGRRRNGIEPVDHAWR
jgi:hypothetical protein